MIYILYHKNCHDGTGAAYCFWKKYNNSAKYIECEYSKPIPEMPNATEVFIVDFSFPRQALIDLATRVKLTVLDHHKTAQADLAGLDFAKFDMSKSGAMLAWEFLNPNSEPPKIIQYIQDRDLWQNKLPHTKEVSAFMFQYERTFEHFYAMEIFIENCFDGCIEQGAAILRYINQLTIQLSSKAREYEILGQKMLVVNTSILQSEVGNKLISEGKTDVVLCYADTSEGGVYCSLRSGRPLGSELPSVDVSKIAEKFGGGGHRNAAGFYLKNTTSMEALEKIARRL